MQPDGIASEEPRQNRHVRQSARPRIVCRRSVPRLLQSPTSNLAQADAERRQGVMDDVFQIEEFDFQIAPVRQQKQRSVAARRLDVRYPELAGARQMSDVRRM